MTLRGSTSDFPLESVIGLLAGTSKTGELQVRGDGKVGALGFAGGRLVAAVMEGEGGENALGAIFAISQADFEFTPWESAPEANLEGGDLVSLLKRAAEARDRISNIRASIPDDRMRFRLSEKAADQGAVTFTPERWRALLAVNGERDVAAHPSFGPREGRRDRRIAPGREPVGCDRATGSVCRSRGCAAARAQAGAASGGLLAVSRGAATDPGLVEHSVPAGPGTRDGGASAARSRVEDEQPGLGGPGGGSRRAGINSPATGDPRRSAERDRATHGRVRPRAGATSPWGRSTPRGRRSAVIALRPVRARARGERATAAGSRARGKAAAGRAKGLVACPGWR